ncbi:MAG: ATP-grasp domain-containing protein [Oscillospiraceae bacterium]
MICNDKYLSKTYIKKFGLNAIPGIIIYSPDNNRELSEINSLSYPLIVKPNFGGGSNGIVKSSVTYNKIQTVNLINQLYSYQHIPIIIEEYIPGYEVSFIIIGNKNKIIFSGESELVIDNNNYFKKEIFGLESKKILPSRKSYHESNHIDIETQNKMFQLFNSFDKIEFMRIDCRITANGTIYVLELSPDCYIGTNGAFQETLKRHGYNFNEMLKLLITNSLNNQNH